MDEDVFLPIVICGMLFVVMPWIVLHYMSQWRKGRGLAVEDERLLDDLHDTARRLDARLDSIERIIAADNPNWRDSALTGREDKRLDDRLADRLADRR